ncbi:oxidoreductase-like domain-containing protein [Marinobacterium weihaiense]|nr:oxidoreductase-like domain-containing protein [Marinobacterium weihaiense]
MMEKPIAPTDGECCESGCEPCVWDTYYEEMRLWREEQKKLAEAETTDTPEE